MTILVLIHQLAACLNEYGNLPVVVDGTEARGVSIERDAEGKYYLEVL